MPPIYSAQRSVLLKILLHATAHPSQAVNGLLLGKVNGKKSAESTSPSDSDSPGISTVEIEDALALFHTNLVLAPMTEAALIQSNILATSKGLKVVGYYHANAALSDLELSSSCKKVADKISSLTPQACILLVDNSCLAEYLQQKKDNFLKLYIKEIQKGWVQAPVASFQADAATVPQLFLDYHSEGRHHSLVDFDDHLNNLKRDWTNPTLLK